MHAPVILGAPVHYEFSQIREVRAVPPASAGDLVRPGDAIQPRAEIGERCLWDSDGEGRKFQDDLPSSAAPSVLVYPSTISFPPRRPVHRFRTGQVRAAPQAEGRLGLHKSLCPPTPFSRLGAELAAQRGRHCVAKAKSTHALRPLLCVRLKGVWRPILRGSKKLAENSYIAKGDREALADVRIAVTGSITDQRHALDDWIIRPAIVHWIGRTRARRSRSDYAVALGDTGEGKAVEKRSRTAGACEAVPMVTGPQQVQTHAAGALRYDEEHPVALGADGHLVFRPAVQLVNEHPGHE